MFIKGEEDIVIKEDIKVDIEEVLSKMYNLEDVVDVDEDREPLNIVFIGHVDSGKSTTCGCILIDSDCVDKSELRKME